MSAELANQKIGRKRMTTRRCLAFLGLSFSTRQEDAARVLRERLVQARRNRDEERQVLLSGIKAFLKRNLRRTCGHPGCGAAVAAWANNCFVHKVRLVCTGGLLVMALTGCATTKERSFAPVLPAIGLATLPYQSVTLAWTASPDAAVTGYNIHHGNVAGTVTNKLDAGFAFTATVSNLIAGTTYFFFATAYNADSVESEPSNIITYTPTNPPPAPPSELRIVVTPQLSGSLDGPWLAVAEWPAITLTNPPGSRFYRMDIKHQAIDQMSRKP